MSWQIRHEGSPTVTSGLTANQVLQGITEGVWELTDEVRGPNETKWLPLEEHPFFQEPLSEYEPNKGRHDDGEEHLDMNPLIDVALVLLIFFILTTSYDALKKVIDMPMMTKKDGIKVMDQKDAESKFIMVKATMVEGNKIKYEVDGKEIEEQHLETAITVGVTQGRDRMIIDVQDVTWDTVVKIIDIGKGARVKGFMMKVDR